MEWIGIAALVIAIIAIVYAFIVSNKPLTAANVTTAINAVPSLATEVEKATTIVVNAYEQARRKNKLVIDPPLNEVMNKVRGWLPKWAKVEATNDQIIEAINSAILMASLVTNQINAAKMTVAEAKVVVAAATPPIPGRIPGPPPETPAPFVNRMGT